MADIGKTLKSAWIKGMEAIGSAANNIASNTKYKMDEMNIINRRREILSDFGARAYEMWQKGTSFPEELEIQLRELNELDTRLNELRMQKLANVDNENKPEEEQSVPEIEVMTEKQNVTAEEIPAAATAQPAVQVMPVSDPINELFEEHREPEQMAQKVNEALDQLGETLEKF